MSLPGAFPATDANKQKAKDIIQAMNTISSTNIISALEVALWLAAQEPNHQSYIMFLTDGDPTEGITDTSKIIELVTELNQNDGPFPLISLSFGEGADEVFLKELSHHNEGEHFHVYEGTDGTFQLLEFYNRFKTPTLSNVTVNNLPQTNGTSRTHFAIYFNGSELSVAGTGYKNSNITITALGKSGVLNLTPKPNKPKMRLERLWVYKMVTHLIKESQTTTNPDYKEQLTNYARLLSRHYGFVTQFTQLAVVKPTENGTVDVEDAFQDRQLPSASIIDGLCNGLPSNEKIII